MRDVLLTAAKQLAAQWKVEAANRFTPPEVKDALDVCANELVAELERVDRETRLLTVEQYCAATGSNPSSVRRWCAKGELAGERNAAREWMIPRGARRAKAG